MTEPQTKPARRTKGTAEAPRQKRSARRQAAAAPAGAAEAIAESSTKGAGPSGKLGIVVALMRRPEGATVAQMSAATDWQPHSVRGALAGALKKKHRLTITSEPAEDGRVYRIAAAAV